MTYFCIVRFSNNMQVHSSSLGDLISLKNIDTKLQYASHIIEFVIMATNSNY